jgi:hypothetical protein
MSGAQGGIGSDARPLQLAAIAGCALALGVLVYLTDRPAETAFLIPSVRAMAGLNLFGGAAGWLPDFLHPFAFSLLTAAVSRTERNAPPYWACALWWFIDIGFEAAQHPAVREQVAAIALGLDDPLRIVASIGRYLHQGTFDVTDVLAATAGACAAAVVLRAVFNREIRDGS